MEVRVESTEVEDGAEPTSALGSHEVVGIKSPHPGSVTTEQSSWPPS